MSEEVSEREIRERMENGEMFKITARQFPGGLLLDPQRTLEQIEIERYHSAVLRDLTSPVWGVHAKDVEAGDTVYLFGDNEKVNVCFGLAAAASGAFNGVYLRAITFVEE